MVLSCSEDFRVVWRDAADALVSWRLDLDHFPRPVPPLCQELLARAASFIPGGRMVFLNGYVYMRLPDFEPPLTPPPLDFFASDPQTLWDTDYLPRVRAVCARMRGEDYEAKSAAALAAALEPIFADAGDAFGYTMIVIFGFMSRTMAFLGFCEQELGPEGAVLAATLLQGFENETTAAGAALAELADAAAALPEVAAALRAGRYDAIASVAGGRAFLARFQGFLAEYGWRAESWGLIHLPTWAEDPSTPLMLIGRYLEDPTRSPAVSIRRSAAQREEAEAEAEKRLSGGKLARFRRYLAAARGHVAISESRALWQLIIMGSFRVPVLALGRKLVAAGVIDEANDAFFLSLADLKEAAAKPGRSWRDEVAQAKADLRRWEKLQAPAFVGAHLTIPPWPLDGPPALRSVFGIGTAPTSEATVVRGQPGSRGVARGRARIIFSLNEANRLQGGDILVCPMTAPPWTPLLAIAAGVVTDSGGILSHSAICAREYGIPCVVGTQDATARIPDGAMITVDGSKGTVTIES